MSARIATLAVGVVWITGCAAAARAPAAPPVLPREAPLPELPASASTLAVEEPPEADVDAPAPSLRLARRRGASGVTAVSVARAGDVTELRLIVRGAGLAAEPSVARAAASALSARLRASPPPSSARVRVSAGLDALVVSLVSTEPALSARAVASALRGHEPRASSAAVDAPPAVEVALFRALFRLPASVHPYAELAPSGHPSPREVARFVDARVVADAITIVAVGALDAAAAHDAVVSALGATRPSPPSPRPTPPVSPDAPRFFVVDAPRAAIEVSVGLLTLDRSDDAWPELVVAARARREHLRASIPSVDVSLTALRDGPSPLVASWRSTAASLVDEVRAVLAALPPEAVAPPLAAHQRATRSLAREEAAVAGQPRRLADRLAELAALGREEPPAPPTLPPTPRLPGSVAEQPSSAPVVVVEGDAATLAPALAALGDVTVLDPARSLAPARVVKASR